MYPPNIRRKKFLSERLRLAFLPNDDEGGRYLAKRGEDEDARARFTDEEGKTEGEERISEEDDE